MKNAELIQHNDKNVLVLDLANINNVEVIKRIKVVEEKLAEFPLGSVYLFSLQTNLSYNSIISSTLHEFSKSNEKYLKAFVVVDESQNLPDGASIDIAPTIKLFSDINAALNFLTAQ